MDGAPHLRHLVNDWFDARQFPHLFDPRAMPAEWRDAQRTLTKQFLALQIAESRCPWNG